MSIIETRRLILRPWREEDAADLYRHASDPEVGPAAGWAPHTSVEDSLQVLRAILMKPDTWAVTLRPSDEPVGSVGVFPSSCSLAKGQPEIGYWLARPLWGNGYSPEAVRALIPQIRAAGYEFVTVSELFSRRQITPQRRILYSYAEQETMYAETE